MTVFERQPENRTQKAENMNTKQTEIGEIPESWEVVKLGEIAEIDSENLPSDTPPNYEFDYISLEMVDNGTLLGTQSICFRSAPSRARRVLRENDVLLSTVRPNLKSHYLVEYEANNLICSTGFSVIRARHGISNPGYLFQHLFADILNNQIELLVSGSNYPAINSKDVKNLAIPLPPKPEQTAIAAILSDTDRLLAALRALIDKNRVVKTGAMQQLLSGRLRLPGSATNGSLKNGELGEIPVDWEMVSYGDIFQFLSTSTNPRSDLTANGELLYLHYGDIHTKLSTHLNIAEISLPKISAKLVSSAIVKDGDVIMADASEDYDGIGKSVEVCNIGAEKMVSGLHTFLLRDADKRLADGYRRFLHCSPSVKRQFNALATGLKVYGVSKGNLKTVLLPLPPKPEQTAIAQTLSDMDSEIAALEARAAKLAQIKQGLMQNLLTGKIRVNTEAA